MAKNKLKADSGKATVVVPPVDAQAVTGSADEALSFALLRQIAGSLWAPGSLSREEQTQKVRAAFAALKGLAPRDELESMLATQMVGTHHAAMECLRRAMVEGQTFEGRDQNLKHAAKLLGVYVRQVEALDKHRNAGQQKITVEHVTVNSGGHAIVGNVGAGAGAPAAAGGNALSTDRPALTHDPAPLAPQLDAARRSKVELKRPTR